jgi:hypothetical protein
MKPKTKNQKSKSGLAWGLITAMSFCFLIFGFCSSRADDLAENQARFGEVEGSVQILTPGAGDWIDAHIDLPLEPGDEIRVDPDSRAELSIAKNVLIVLEEDSQAIIGHTTTQETHLTMREGALFGKVETEGHRGVWTIETPASVCAIRGTEFSIVHTSEDGTHLGVFKGAVEMRPAESATQNYAPTIIGAQQEGVLKRNQPLQQLKTFSPLMQRQRAQQGILQKRFRQRSDVWVPMTAAYRKEMRGKYVLPPKPMPKRPHAGGVHHRKIQR